MYSIYLLTLLKHIRLLEGWSPLGRDAYMREDEVLPCGYASSP